MGNEQKNRVAFVFLISAAGVLGSTGVAKVWSDLGNSKFLAVVDPIIGVKFGQLILMVGVAEIFVGLICFFSKRQGANLMNPVANHYALLISPRLSGLSGAWFDLREATPGKSKCE